MLLKQLELGTYTKNSFNEKLKKIENIFSLARLLAYTGLSDYKPAKFSLRIFIFYYLHKIYIRLKKVASLIV